MAQNIYPRFKVPVRIEAGLWFAYGQNKRDDVASETTFDAVLHGERISTTRFKSWPGHDSWKSIQPGDLILFQETKDRTGRSCVVGVTVIEEIDLKRCNESTLETWSRCEGWSPQKGRELGRLFGPALWLRHKLEWPQLKPKPQIPDPKPTQMSLF